MSKWAILSDKNDQVLATAETLEELFEKSKKLKEPHSFTGILESKSIVV